MSPRVSRQPANVGHHIAHIFDSIYMLRGSFAIVHQFVYAYNTSRKYESGFTGQVTVP